MYYSDLTGEGESSAYFPIKGETGGNPVPNSFAQGDICIKQDSIQSPRPAKAPIC